MTLVMSRLLVIQLPLPLEPVIEDGSPIHIELLAGLTALVPELIGLLIKGKGSIAVEIVEHSVVRVRATHERIVRPH